MAIDEKELKAAKRIVQQAVDAMAPADIIQLAMRLRKASADAMLGLSANRTGGGGS